MKNAIEEKIPATLPPVLVIDDDPSVLRTLQAVCESMASPHLELRLDTATAVDAAMDPKFGLIVCDYRFPGDSGVTFVREMRRRGVKTPVLFISGTPDADAVLQAAQIEHAVFLGKPFTLHRFRQAIEGLLRLTVET